MFLSHVSPPPMNFFLFSNRGKDARIEEGTTGDEAERCEVRKSAAVVAGMGMGWGGGKGAM